MNRVAIFERASNMLLSTNEVVALAIVAVNSLDRDRQLLSTCQYCGGQRQYASKRGKYVYEHDDDCPAKVIDEIGGVEEKHNGAQDVPIDDAKT